MTDRGRRPGTDVPDARGPWQGVDDVPPQAAAFQVWIDGEPGAPAGVHVSARDRGLMLADGVFETMRAHGRVIFRLERHLRRLRAGLAALEIPEPPGLRMWIQRALDEAGAFPVSVRLTVTRGVGAGGTAAPDNLRPTVIILVTALPAFPPAVYESGLDVHVASGRRNEYAPTAGLKTLAFTDSVVGWLEARRAGADEALFLDTEGHCSEASSSNLFAWIARTLVTPPLSCGALPGITRETVLGLAREARLPYVERPIWPEELRAAEEVFLTSSLRGLAPVRRVGPDPVGAGRPGEVFRGLRDAYLAAVARECGACA